MTLLRSLVLSLVLAACCAAQQDPLQEGNRLLREGTDGKFSLTFEERTRWEERYGVNFGRSVNQQDMLSRIRIGAIFQPTEWLKISAMGQDSRAAFFGIPAPNNIRDTFDLQESYVHLFDNHKQGFGAGFGREMLNYGETRVIGVPQWGNVARTFDNARMYYRTKKNRFEVLLISPVKINTESFNKPELGERIWGTYNVFSNIAHGISADAYALRHSQNRPGGFSAAGTLGTNSFGGRLYGPLPHRFTYSLEGIAQAGHIGALDQRAFAWFAGVTHTVNLGSRALVLSAEYKVASGTKPGSTNSGSYDQLSPANHDKFGHADLFGWRNLKIFRSQETLAITKRLALNLMYTDLSLYSSTDGLYSNQGTLLGQSRTGTAGTHVGRELDLFGTYTRGAHLFGAGFGHFFKGEFVNNATSHVNPRYFYVFQQYSFK